MKIYIVGTGGVGGYLGGKLANEGNDVTFVTRNKFYEAIKANGLKVNSTDGNFLIKPAQTINSIDQISDPDLIIFSVKTYDTQEIAKQLNNVINDNTYIITFQNGIENDIEIKKYLKKGKVFPGIAFVISAIGEPGVINQTGGPKKFKLGSRDRKPDEQLQRIQEIFLKAKIDTTISDDITRDLWIKYIFINAFAGFTAICRTNIGNIRKDKFSYDLYKQAINESIIVAKSIKVNLPITIFTDTVKLTETFTPESKSSLLIDIENNRKNEIETLNGTLVRLANAQKISIPINQMIYCALKQREI